MICRFKIATRAREHLQIDSNHEPVKLMGRAKECVAEQFRDKTHTVALYAASGEQYATVVKILCMRGGPALLIEQPAVRDGGAVSSIDQELALRRCRCCKIAGDDADPV